MIEDLLIPLRELLFPYSSLNEFAGVLVEVVSPGDAGNISLFHFLRAFAALVPLCLRSQPSLFFNGSRVSPTTLTPQFFFASPPEPR